MTAIRGAICAGSNSKAAISRATKQLRGEILRRNGLQTVRIAAAWFTMTPDLDAEFPAHVAREMGWEDVPMLCSFLGELGRSVVMEGQVGSRLGESTRDGPTQSPSGARHECDASAEIHIGVTLALVLR